MKCLYLLLAVSSLCNLQACSKKQGRNEVFISNYYGTTFNIRNNDTLDTFYTHIRLREIKNYVVFTSEELESADSVVFPRNKDGRYTSERLNEVYDVHVQGTALYFSFTRNYPGGGFNRFSFYGFRQ